MDVWANVATVLAQLEEAAAKNELANFEERLVGSVAETVEQRDTVDEKKIAAITDACIAGQKTYAAIGREFGVDESTASPIGSKVTARPMCSNTRQVHPRSQGLDTFRER